MPLKASADFHAQRQLLSGLAGELRLPYFDTDTPMVQYWQAQAALSARADGPHGRVVFIEAGTNLRLIQADGLWIGLEYGNRNWYELVVLAGPRYGEHVFVDGDLETGVLPPQLRNISSGPINE